MCICIERMISGMMPTRYTNCMLSFVLCCLVNVQVAKAQGGSNAANQVAYLWAKTSRYYNLIVALFHCE